MFFAFYSLKHAAYNFMYRAYEFEVRVRGGIVITYLIFVCEW